MCNSDKWRHRNHRHVQYSFNSDFSFTHHRIGTTPYVNSSKDQELFILSHRHDRPPRVWLTTYLLCLQVPQRFIEVSEVALREFYSAIWTGRDSDPCWKKGIYKIICKLDSPVPDAFRLPGCPVGWRLNVLQLLWFKNSQTVQYHISTPGTRKSNQYYNSFIQFWKKYDLRQ